jgi:hypothetical protein
LLLCISATSARPSSNDSQAFVEFITFFSSLFLFRPIISPNKEYLTPVHNLFNRHLLLDFENASASKSYALSQAFWFITPDISEKVMSKSSFVMASPCLGVGGGVVGGVHHKSISNFIFTSLVSATFHLALFLTSFIHCIGIFISIGNTVEISTGVN